MVNNICKGLNPPSDLGKAVHGHPVHEKDETYMKKFHRPVCELSDNPQHYLKKSNASTP